MASHQGENSRSGGTTPVSYGTDSQKEVTMHDCPEEEEEDMDLVAHNTRGSVSSDSKSETDDNGSSSHNNKANKHLRMLSFANPGRFMEDFDPERSAREMRKINRRVYRDSVKKNQVFDDSGRLLTDSQDLCDCLEVTCPGCHFPCPKCGSEKCGSDCRCNRKWVYSEVEIEGTNHRLHFSQQLPLT